jgi:hypothetical protein
MGGESMMATGSRGAHNKRADMEQELKSDEMSRANQASGENRGCEAALTPVHSGNAFLPESLDHKSLVKKNLRRDSANSGSPVACSRAG